MKILCAYSSIEFNVEHFPGTFYSREAHHPIFDLPQKKLLSYTGKWAAGELTPTDSYLLFLALLKSSDQVDFRIPVFRAPQTDGIIARDMEFLVRTVIKLNTVTNPNVTFPSYVITPETRYLTNVHYWIENWDDAYKEYLSKATKYNAHDSAKLIHRENALQRMIKNPHKQVRDYASQIAEWAATAGEFPNFLTQSPIYKTQVPISEYWKAIITRCAKEEYLFSIPKQDLVELIEHCEDKIPIGSIYSNALFKLLRKALQKQENFLGIGDMDVRSTFQILNDTDTIESANLRAAIDSAPLEEPRQEQYPTKFLYMKAKFRWDMAKKFEKEKKESGDRREGT